MQLDGIWMEKERLIAQAVKKDKDRMDELNKLLATVGNIRSGVSHVSYPI